MKSISILVNIPIVVDPVNTADGFERTAGSEAVSVA